MVRRFVAAACAASLSASAALAQVSSEPVPLFPTPPPSSLQSEPLPPIAPTPDVPAARPVPREPGLVPGGGLTPPLAGAPSPGAPATPGDGADHAAARVFCEQRVTVRVADPERVPARYREFIGMWSDAAWTPQLCAALIVEDVAGDGTARIVYAFGPMGSGARGGPGGTLHGTGVIKDGELRFQNSDGSQFAFRPVYSDLDGRLTTPQAQNHRAIFKKTP